MDGSIDRQMDGRMDGMDGCMDRRAGWMNRWMDG